MLQKREDLQIAFVRTPVFKSRTCRMIKNLFHWEIQGTSVLTGNLAQVFLLEDQLMETYEQMFCELHLPDLYRVWIKVHPDNWKSVKIVDLSRFWNFRWLHSSYSWNSHVLPLPLGAWQVEIENIGWFDPELRKFRSYGRRFRRWQFSQKKVCTSFLKSRHLHGCSTRLLTAAGLHQHKRFLGTWLP